MLIDRFRDQMRTDDAAIDDFVAACDDMVASGKYLIAEQKIQAILMSIITSTRLHDLFVQLGRKVDPATLLAQHTNAQGALTLPDTPQTLAALVFGILVDIESRAWSIDQFLDTFFDRPDRQQSYALMLNQLIVPFRNAVRSLCHQPQPVTQPAIDPNVNVDDWQFVEFAGGILRDISDIVNTAGQVTADQRAEVLALLTPLANAISNADFVLARNLYIGFRSICKNSPLAPLLADLLGELGRLFLPYL